MAKPPWCRSGFGIGSVCAVEFIFVLTQRRKGAETQSCSAGFQTCCIADFKIGGACERSAGLETRDTADLEVCATSATWHLCVFAFNFFHRSHSPMTK